MTFFETIHVLKTSDNFYHTFRSVNFDKKYFLEDFLDMISWCESCVWFFSSRTFWVFQTFQPAFLISVYLLFTFYIQLCFLCLSTSHVGWRHQLTPASSKCNLVIGNLMKKLQKHHHLTVAVPPPYFVSIFQWCNFSVCRRKSVKIKL